jgi:hypothetical protein
MQEVVTVLAIAGAAFVVTWAVAELVVRRRK